MKLDWERLQSRLLGVVKDEIQTAAAPYIAAAKAARTAKAGNSLFDALNGILRDVGELDDVQADFIDVTAEKVEEKSNP